MKNILIFIFIVIIFLLLNICNRREVYITGGSLSEYDYNVNLYDIEQEMHKNYFGNKIPQYVLDHTTPLPRHLNIKLASLIPGTNKSDIDHMEMFINRMFTSLENIPAPIPIYYHFNTDLIKQRMLEYGNFDKNYPGITNLNNYFDIPRMVVSVRNNIDIIVLMLLINAESVTRKHKSLNFLWGFNGRIIIYFLMIAFGKTRFIDLNSIRKFVEIFLDVRSLPLPIEDDILYTPKIRITEFITKYKKMKSNIEKDVFKRQAFLYDLKELHKEGIKLQKELENQVTQKEYVELCAIVNWIQSILMEGEHDTD